MSQTLNAAIAVVGIDIGKNSFHIVGQDSRGADNVPRATMDEVSSHVRLDLPVL